ncbi:MAG: hypothetical protein IIB12_03605 [Chloroflexi bacterium]|nr:hypothetical protein [Chloroflexota bacterium]
MTKETASRGETEQDDQQQAPKYYIDESWFERVGRSLQHLIESRVTEPGDIQDKSAKRRRKKAAVSMADLAQIEGFVNPELPLLEAIFRLLLVHENKPMDVEQLSQELAERGIGIRDARPVDPETLIRVLANDDYYGLTQLGKA